MNDLPTTVAGEDAARQRFLADVLAGLAAQPKTLPCKYLYDERGSQLFDRICETGEYYPTRTELAITREFAGEIAELVGPRVALVEYGSGSSTKTELLLDHLVEPVAYVPVDISGEHLDRSAAAIAERHPKLLVQPVHADFTEPFELPDVVERAERIVAYFPGSTIGNFATDAATALLASIAEQVGSGGELLIGVDLLKPVDVLERAYDDAAGVTRGFSRNLLVRINRELGGNFDVDAFEHRARFDAERSRIEIHLVSRRPQRVRVRDAEFDFAAGETIHTENSHKYTRASFAAIANRAGFAVEHVWTDPQEWFSVQLLRAE